MKTTEPAPAAVCIGDNPTRLWGLDMSERVRRMARASGLPEETDGPLLLVNADFAFDPAWFRYLAENPGYMLTLAGVPVLAHVASDGTQAAAIGSAIQERHAPVDQGGLTVLRFEDGPTVENKQLRKRETPFVIPLTPQTVRQVERASYFGAYKGVTDALTKYLWPEWALVLTRIAARVGMTPNMVTAIGAILCIAATFAFAYGEYWLGTAAALIFMVLDTVDGKLARCTITSSWWGNVFDHGIDLVHPPFWWWFWATGLVHWGLGLSETNFWLVQAAIQGGYLIQRLIEGAFISWFDGLHIHVWQRFDSRFRLITARRNPNMAILFVSLVFGRPDLGIIAVAWWTVISCFVHAVRLGQAWLQHKQGQPIQSWLAGGTA